MDEFESADFHIQRRVLFQGPLSIRTSLGKPSTRSPTMLRWISPVPPRMVSERAAKKLHIHDRVENGAPGRSMKKFAGFMPHGVVDSIPMMSIARFVSRWWYSDHMILNKEPSGPVGRSFKASLSILRPIHRMISTSVCARARRWRITESFVTPRCRATSTNASNCARWMIPRCVGSLPRSSLKEQWIQTSPC